jgi:hypothetical protein
LDLRMLVSIRDQSRFNVHAADHTARALRR